MRPLKPGAKKVLIILAVFAIGFGIYKFTGNSDKTKGDTKASNSIESIFGDDVYTIGVNTYAGFTPIIWLNGGLEPNENSVIYKEYGIKLKIVIQDDFLAGRSAFKGDTIDMIYCTTDVLSTEMGSSSDMLDARQFMILNKSRGADALVVNKNIKTVADLKGKVIAVAESTASHTLLINTLETNGISTNDVKIVKVNNGMDAAADFKAGRVDACVTWSPDDADCVDAIPGSKVLVSTKQASELITDGLIAKQSFIDKNKEDITKIISAILYANSLMNTDEAIVKEAAGYFAKAFGTDEAFCIQGCKNIRFATLGDEANFFGLNSTYTGTQADEIYSKMARIYAGIGLTKSPASWRKVSDLSMIEALWDSKNVKGNQEAESKTTFAIPTKEIKQKTEISNKKITINFETNSSILNLDARNIIDREFVSIAKQFDKARIQVEGNCDATGDIKVNRKLSEKRAQAVVDYLVTEYGFDSNRFIVIGNGSKHAIEDNIQGASSTYRTTDFKLKAE